MSRLEQLERDIRNLSPEELRDFRAWFVEHDSELWDRQFEADAQSGKLDSLVERGLRDHANGRSTKL
jgi:hypothetical protein